MDDLTKVLLRGTPAAQLMKTFAALTHQMHEAEHDVNLRAQRDVVEEEILSRAGGYDAHGLMTLVDAYADAHAQRFWQDDQGTGSDVDTARQKDEDARVAVLKVLGLSTW